MTVQHDRLSHRRDSPSRTASSQPSQPLRPPQPARFAAPNFDPLARLYRWMEYLSFGRTLERCRFHFLDELLDRQQALILGDGDGRFTARLLARSTRLRAHAIDGSRAMLAALCRRARTLQASDRLTVELADLRCWTGDSLCNRSPQPGGQPDLIVTHFFLDCLTTSEVDRLARCLHGLASDNTLWVVSEFAIPARGWMHPLATVLISALYRAFRLLTGLGPQRLPDYAAALEGSGWRRTQRREQLRGLLVSELWRRDPSPQPSCSARRLV